MAIALVAMVSISASAAVITTAGSGSAVTNVFRQALFTGISGSLLNYTEGGLIVSTNNSQCCFSDTYYGAGGGNNFVTITTPESFNFAGLELDLGSGFFNVGPHNVVWQTYRDSGLTDSGVITGVNAGYPSTFSVLGWSDVNLFDTLLIGAAPTSTGYNTFGQFQAVALDNVKLDMNGRQSVPEPASIALFGLGMLGFAAARRRKQ